MSYRMAATSSDTISSSGSVTTRPGLLCNVTLTPAAAAATITIYDNASVASGKVLYALSAIASGPTVPANLSIPIIANNGIYASISGSGATATVSYILE